MTKTPLLPMLFALAFGMSCADVAAQQSSSNIAVRGGHSGHWFNPAQDGHGLHIEVIDSSRVVVTWYAYANDGRPHWVIGSGRIRGKTINVDVSELAGGRPPARWGESDVGSVAWGTLRIDFSDCNEGTVHWSSQDPAFGSGTMPISRLSKVDGTRCYGEEEFGQQLVYSFERGTLDFSALFVDYPAGKANEWGIESEWTDLPDDLLGRKGIRLTGSNHSLDLAMLVKSPIRGLRPDTRYEVELEMELASNARTGCSLDGEAPGDDVVVKLGANTFEPLSNNTVEGGVTVRRLNIDIGQWNADGQQGVTVGNIATSHACEGDAEAGWEFKTFSTQGKRKFLVRTDNEGTLWVLGGTDSSYDGRTEVYVTAFRVRLDPRDTLWEGF